MQTARLMTEPRLCRCEDDRTKTKFVSDRIMAVRLTFFLFDRFQRVRVNLTRCRAKASAHGAPIVCPTLKRKDFGAAHVTFLQGSLHCQVSTLPAGDTK